MAINHRLYINNIVLSWWWWECRYLRRYFTINPNIWFPDVLDWTFSFSFELDGFGTWKVSVYLLNLRGPRISVLSVFSWASFQYLLRYFSSKWRTDGQSHAVCLAKPLVLTKQAISNIHSLLWGTVMDTFKFKKAKTKKPTFNYENACWLPNSSLIWVLLRQ